MVTGWFSNRLWPEANPKGVLKAFLRILVLIWLATALCCRQGKDAISMQQGPSEFEILSKGLSGRLNSSPFFWQSGARGTNWQFCYATTENDPAQRGSATAIQFLDKAGRAFGSPSIKGLEVFAGHQLMVADLNGDRQDELLIIDWTGQIRAYDIQGRMLAGFPTPPSDSRVLLGIPLLKDLNGDGKPELIILSAEQVMASSKSALTILDNGGRPLAGFPIALNPPAVTPPILLRQAAPGSYWIAFCQGNGDIVGYDALGRRSKFGSVAAEYSAALFMTSADVNADGTDEIIFVQGDNEIRSLSQKNIPVDGWPLPLYDAVFTAVVAGKAADGTPVVFAYDSKSQLLAFWNGKEMLLQPRPLPGSKTRILARLASVDAPNNQGCLFIAELCTPEGETAVDPVFEEHAKPEAKAEYRRYSDALHREYKSREPLTQAEVHEMENDLLQYKRDLLVDQMGEKPVSALLSVNPGTEIWAFDATGKPLDGMPLKVEGQYPFLDKRQRIASLPSVLRDHQTNQLLLLVGMNGKSAEPGSVHVFKLK